MDERGNRGKGLIAARAFVPGEMLISTAKHVMLTPDTARSSHMGNLFAQAGLTGCASGDATSQECTALLVFHLVDEYHNESSPLAPWMKLFPRQLTSPLFWSEDEYEELQGSNLYDICQGWRSSIEGLYKRTVAALKRKFPAKFTAKSLKSSREGAAVRGKYRFGKEP